MPERDPAPTDPAITSCLVDAAAARRRVRLTYRGESGREFDTDVDPRTVVARPGRWYLLCHSHHADAVRTFRIDRIQAARHTTETFDRPGGLDPIAVLEENLGTGWQYPTRVVFAAPYAEVAPWIRPPMGRLEPLDDDSCVLVGSTRDTAVYAVEWLAAIPLPFRIEGGAQLRAQVAGLAERLRTAVEDAAHS